MKQPFLLFISFFIVIFFPVFSVSGQFMPVIEWQKCLGGSANDYGYCVHQTTDGGAILRGFTQSTDGDALGNTLVPGESWVVKLDAARNIEWQRYMSAAFNPYSNIEQTTDGGYIAGGDSLTKLTSAGQIDWMEPIAGNIVHQLQDGGYVVTHNFFTSYPVASVTKLNAMRQIQWCDTLGANTGGMSILEIEELSNGNFIVEGTTGQDPGPPYGVVFMLLPSGGYLTQISTNQSEYLVKDISGSFGLYRSYQQDSTVLKKYDANGIQLGSIKFNGNNGGLFQLFDSSYVIVLNINGDLKFCHYAINGDSLWSKTIGGSGNELIRDVCATSDGEVIVTGSTSSNDGDVSGNHGGISDLWVVKFGAFPTYAGTLSLESDIRVYPTLTNDFTDIVMQKGSENVQLRIIDIMGRQIACRQEVNGLRHRVYFTGQAEGQYYIQLACKNYSKSYKILYYKE